METLLASAFGRLVRTGALTVTFASGRTRSYGDGSEAPLAIRFADSGAERRVALDPALGLGEMFTDGRLTVERGSIYDVVSLLKRNGVRRLDPSPAAALALFRIARDRVKGAVTPEKARRNVAHHYDLEAGLFDLFLDEDRQYSCAYYETPDDSLEAAQLAKKRHIAAKLLLQPGAHVLDIGCGWGGLALYLAEVAGVRATGVTLSEEQLKIARQRADTRGLADRVRFQLEDYRRVEGPFDRIVSVGMFEHVGKRSYPAFFAKAASLMERRHGVMLLHSIGRTRPAFINQPFVDKYIFPGGYIPALSEVLPAAEQAGLLVKDLEILPMHYAWTLRAWRERFMANRDRAVALYDERFCRMWEFYLATSETAFRHDRLFIFQLQLARHQDAVPFRRDYIATAEARLRRGELATIEKQGGRASSGPVQQHRWSGESMKQDVDALEALASTLTDSINGYEEAAEVATNAGISGYLRQKAQERRTITENFRQRIASLGGDADVSGSVSAALHRRFLDLRSMFQNDTKAAVAEVERGENYLKERFESFIQDTGISSDTREFLRSTYERVRFDHAKWDQLKQAQQAA